MFKTTDNGQKFFIIDVIIALCWYYALVIEGYRVKNFFLIVLRENFISYQIRGVCL